MCSDKMLCFQNFFNVFSMKLWRKRLKIKIRNKETESTTKCIQERVEAH